MIHKIFIIVFCMVTSFQSCSYQQKNNNNDIDSVSQSDSINSKDYYPEKIWKSDSLGCMGKRNISLARSIIEQHSLLGKTKNQFCSLFGNPNEIIKSENQIDLIYYIETMCNNNIVVQGADKSYIGFIFVNDTLIDIPEGIYKE